MVKVAKKFGVRCSVSNPSHQLRNAIPIWYHKGWKEGRSVANTVAAKCLRERHLVSTTAQCAKVAARLKSAAYGHVARANCGCADCDSDRRVRCCNNPHRCATAALKLVDRLRPKWHPDRRANDDGLTLTRTRMDANRAARLENDRVTFDPTITQGLPLAETFRVFTTGEDCVRPALRPRKRFQVAEEAVEV
ncbi:hypothetical protein OH77DRAFT_1358796, partial [Trametes cingulata]